MKRMLLYFLLAGTLAAGCSSPGIRNTESSISRDMLREKIGLISIDFKIPDKAVLDFYITKTREGIIEDNSKSLDQKNILVAQLSDFTYSENRLFLFRIRHTKPVHRDYNASTFSFTDARGNSIVEKKMDTTIKWSGDGTMYEQCLIIKTMRPVTAKNFSAGESPLTFSTKFMGSQRLVYAVTPN
jgi:hypothetical protein